MIPTLAEDTVTRILMEKIRLEKEGKTPRVILLGTEVFYNLNKEWLENIKSLPWGESLSYELEQRKKNDQDVFLGDGNLFGLWVIKVNTIDGFEVR